MTAGRLLVIAGGLICLVLVILFARGNKHESAPPPSPADNEPAAPAPETPRAIPSPAQAAPAPAPQEERVVTSDGLPIMPARGEPNGPAHPHPITPQHQRIYAENRLVGALDGAMDVKDVPAMRRLLEQYRREYPEDDNMLQDGYAVIADCFEHPGDASRAAAERWLPSHNGSKLKRFVNRHCLER